MKQVIPTLIWVLLALQPAIADDSPGTTLSACYTTWGKYGGDDLPAKGFIPDLVTRVFEHAGYSIEIKIVPWPRCIQLAKALQFDLVASAWQGENFEPDFEYLDITSVETINFISLKSAGIDSGELDNFTGKRVGYLRDSGGMDVFEDQDQIEVIKAAEQRSLLNMLKGGRIDAFVSDPLNTYEAAEALEPGLSEQLEVLEPALQANYNSPLVSRQHPDLETIRTDFNRAFRELIADGLYEELIEIHDLPVQHPH